MVGEIEGGGEISRTRARRTIDAGLEGIALAAAEPLRQTPIGAAAGKRDAHHTVARKVIIEPAGKSHRRSGEVVAADHRGVAADAAAAAEGPAPGGPALLEARRLLRRSLEHLRVGERDVVRERFAFGSKAQRRVVRPAE